MFALRIEFHDGVSAPETLLVRRSDAIVGASEWAHVVLEGASSAIPEFCLVRGLGREFYCRAVSRRSSGGGSSVNLVSTLSIGSAAQGGSAIPSGVFDGVAELRLGEASTRIWSLDLDLFPIGLSLAGSTHSGVAPSASAGSLSQGAEPPDKAALRTLRSALTFRTPIFPAFAVIGDSVALYSFRSDMKILVGRSRRCLMRTDAVGVANEHARLWCEGNEFLISPHPTSGGVYVNGELVTSGNTRFAALSHIRVGSVEIVGLQTVEDLQIFRSKLLKRPHYQIERRSYPALLVKGPALTRPQRFAFGRKSRLIVGRDPACDVWLQDVHISSEHLTLTLDESEDVIVEDSSSNGTFLGGSKLERGRAIHLNRKYAAFDLQLGLELAVCFSPAEESQYFPGVAPDPRDLAKSGSFELPAFRCEKALLEISQFGADQTIFGHSSFSLEQRSVENESKPNEDPNRVRGSDSIELDRDRSNFRENLDEEYEAEGEMSATRTQSVSGVSRFGAAARGPGAVGSVNEGSAGKIKSSWAETQKGKLSSAIGAQERDSRDGLEEFYGERPNLSRVQKLAMAIAVFGLVMIALVITVELLVR